MAIVVEPIPAGHFCAYDDDQFDGPDSPIGIGRTEDEARADLADKLEPGPIPYTDAATSRRFLGDHHER